MGFCEASVNQRHDKYMMPKIAISPEPIESMSDEEDVECEVCDGAERKVGELKFPELPKFEEVKAHVDRGHVPFRSWCAHCVRGAGTYRCHNKVKGKETEVNTTLSIDYMYLKEKTYQDREEDRDSAPTLVIVDRKTKMKIACVVKKQR